MVLKTLLRRQDNAAIHSITPVVEENVADHLNPKVEELAGNRD